MNLCIARKKERLGEESGLLVPSLQLFYASLHAELSEGEQPLQDWFFMNDKGKSAVLTMMKGSRGG